MKRSTPLRSKRPSPRREEGRVTHERLKPKTKVPATADEKRHFARLVSLGCLVCGSTATIHHVTSDGLKRITRSHRRTVPLCAVHHQIQHGPRESVEALGHAGFTAMYSIDLLARADEEWTISCRLYP